jgi:DNA-binding GntR family transcriptional regulator
MRWTRPGGDMVCYTHSYIPKRLMKYAGELPGRVGAFYAHLEARSGEEVVEAVQEIRTERASRDVAAHLGIEVGQVTLCVQRRYISHEGTLITSLNWHVAENFVYRTQIYRNR